MEFHPQPFEPPTQKMIIANETKMHNPSTFVSIKNIFKDLYRQACEVE